MRGCIIEHTKVVRMPEEKVFTIPLGEAVKKARVHRARYASALVRSYLQTHTKKKNIKIGDMLNRAIWARGTQKPPRSVRVKALLDGDTVKAELFGYDYKEFKAISVAKKEKMIDKLKAHLSAKEQQALETEKKIEGKTTKHEELKPEEPKPASGEAKHEAHKPGERPEL